MYSLAIRFLVAGIEIYNGNDLALFACIHSVKSDPNALSKSPRSPVKILLDLKANMFPCVICINPQPSSIV